MAEKKPAKTATKKPVTAKKATKFVPKKWKAVARKRIGRPSLYSEAIADAICEQISDGKSLKEVCGDESMPCYKTVQNWLSDSSKGEFLHKYARAREAQADYFAEEILRISDEEVTTVRADKHPGADADEGGMVEVVFDAVAVARNRLRVDSRKWLASKLAPKKYGDRMELAGDLKLVTIKDLSGRGGE